jgi:hypothetical protein
MEVLDGNGKVLELTTMQPHRFAIIDLVFFAAVARQT